MRGRQLFLQILHMFCIIMVYVVSLYIATFSHVALKKARKVQNFEKKFSQPQNFPFNRLKKHILSFWAIGFSEGGAQFSEGGGGQNFKGGS